ncbi:NAD dependent epimerase/dehydratase family protein [Marinomonas spartinae]|uniref:UDP-2-acetamido-2,6-beta-L-arabino-hexul-4-ose reductase n=1 Tax=Marinomonas spartinae TaxID=1792290 RepID=UPI000808F0DC|nr:NAD-dependent epimerase/dehydratase family protein [Marinomonas spartinae]SBS40429.1 NAD dependent epimerase/dehydratase family protein [Marinomonas spartinae]
MKVLVTGADGFIGKNLCISLARIDSVELLKFTRGMPDEILVSFIQSADFIFHLAGINRPDNDDEFFIGNADLTGLLCQTVSRSGRNIPIVLTSSIQAERANSYGRSKLKAEMHLLSLYMETGNSIYIYRLPNVFGKWCRPNYNSVVATFCHNISHGLPIQINDPNVELSLVHVGAVVTSFIDVLLHRPAETLYINVDPVYKVTLGELADQLVKFKDSRDSLITEPVGDGFVRVLYATYISYISPDSFSYPLVKHEDSRGAFVEMLKTRDSGQFSFFTAHPGVTRGGHYHHVKTEKFLVIKGTARFGFRHIVTNKFVEIITSGECPEIVETVPGWSHDITNIGNDEMVVMLWANENFDRQRPDTVTYKVN